MQPFLTSLSHNLPLGPARTVVVFHGPPGSGKSTMAGLLNVRLGYQVVSFDSHWQRSGLRADRATTDERNSVYGRALSEAFFCLHRGNVVIDCTSRSTWFRTYIGCLFQAAGARVIYIACIAAPAVARRRVLARILIDRKHVGKGAAIFEAMQRTFEPIREEERRSCLVFETSQFPPRLLNIHAESEEDNLTCQSIAIALDERQNMPSWFARGYALLILAFFARIIEIVDKNLCKKKHPSC